MKLYKALKKIKKKLKKTNEFKKETYLCWIVDDTFDTPEYDDIVAAIQDKIYDPLNGQMNLEDWLWKYHFELILELQGDDRRLRIMLKKTRLAWLDYMIKEAKKSREEVYKIKIESSDPY